MVSDRITLFLLIALTLNTKIDFGDALLNVTQLSIKVILCLTFYIINFEQIKGSWLSFEAKS